MLTSSTIRQFQSLVFQGRHYLDYFLNRVDHHSLHSPSLFTLYNDLREYRNRMVDGIQDIEVERERLISDKSLIQVTDLGAGSRFSQGNSRRISDIAKGACSSLSQNLLHQFLCSITPARNVLELGTSLGINTAYLAEVADVVHTFEGCPNLLSVARHSCRRYKNIRYHLGDIGVMLPSLLKKWDRVDFCHIDANHTYAATMDYVGMLWEKLHEKSVVVIGDIHWSQEMYRAWEEISSHPLVGTSLDFFECGVLLFSKHSQVKRLPLYYPR